MLQQVQTGQSGTEKMKSKDKPKGNLKGITTNHADRVDSVPLVCDGVALAKEHMAKVGAAVAAHCLESRALGTAEHVAVFAGPEA